MPFDSTSSRNQVQEQALNIATVTASAA